MSKGTFSGVAHVRPLREVTCVVLWLKYTLICPSGKIKIENVHVLDIHWLYRTSRYVIVKSVVTECNDVTKHHIVVITIWCMSAIRVTALSKTHFQN